MGLLRRCATAVAAVIILGSLGTPPAAADGNTPPVANPDAVTTEVGVAVVLDPRANDTDVENGPLTLTYAVLQSGSATLALDPVAQTVSITPTAIGPVVVLYQVADSGGATAQGTINVTVLPPPNRNPVAVADSGRMVSGGQVRLDPRVNDTDPDGEALVVTRATVISGLGSVAIEDSGLVILGAKGFIGSLVVAYVVSDPRGGQGKATVTITVTPVPNRRPVAVADSVTAKAGRTYRIRVLANDRDPDGDRVTLVSVGKAKHGKAHRSGSRIVYQAPSSWTGRERITYTIKDSKGARSRGILTIKVERRPPAPQPSPPARAVSPRAVETALARLGLPTGIVNGTYDTRTRRALCAWRTATGRPADRRLPTAAEARAIVAASGLPRARSSMVTGVNVSLTCQAAFWVGANREYRRVMAASTGKPGYGTRLGIHRVFRTHRVWRYSTIYPEARMYKPMQFSGGQAMHGSATDSLVKTYPASHGCVRMLHRDIDALQAGGVGNGTLVRVFGAW
jgi:hypothetical protein